MRVLLISINRIHYPYPVHPIGLDYVAGALEPAHQVQLLDLCPLSDLELPAAVAEAVRAQAPEVVGLSIRNVDDAGTRTFLGEMQRAVAAVRAVTSAPLVLGGAGYALFPQALLEALEADYGVVGDGGRTRALIDALEAGASPEEVPGVHVRGRPYLPPAHGPGAESGAMVQPPVRAPLARNPALGHYLSHGGILGIQTQRGCPFRCVYCSYPLIEGGQWRRFEAEAVGREARSLQEAGARFLFITDSVFNASPEHSLEVAAAFRRAGLSIPWSAYFAPRAAPDGFYQELKQAGCTHVEFGTESLSDAMLARLGKCFTRADVRRAHRAARAAGLHVAHFMLLGGPGETLDTVDETLEGCEQLEGAALFFFCGVRIYPGTPLEQQARAMGQLPLGELNRRLLEPVIFRPEGISVEAIRQRVEARAAHRISWVVGAGAACVEALVARMHARGATGPLWERLAGA